MSSWSPELANAALTARVLCWACAGSGGRRGKVALEEPVVEQSSLIMNASCRCVVQV